MLIYWSVSSEASLNSFSIPAELQTLCIIWVHRVRSMFLRVYRNLSSRSNADVQAHILQRSRSGGVRTLHVQVEGAGLRRRASLEGTTGVQRSQGQSSVRTAPDPRGWGNGHSHLPESRDRTLHRQEVRSVRNTFKQLPYMSFNQWAVNTSC